MLTQKSCSLLQDHDQLKSLVASALPSSTSHDLGMSQKRWLLAPSNTNNVADKHTFLDSGLAPGYPVHAMLPSNPMLNVARVPVYPPEETSIRPLTSDMKYPTVQVLQPQILMVPQPSERARHGSSNSPTRQPTVAPRASVRTPEPVLVGSWKDPPPLLSGFKESGYMSEGAGRVLGEFGRGSARRLSGSTRESVARPVLQRLNAIPNSPTGRSTATRPPLPTSYAPYRQQGPCYRDTAEYKVWVRLCQEDR